MKPHNGMRPHDIVVLLKILSMEEGWMSKDLAASLFISGSEISESLNRSMIARLVSPDKKTVYKNALFDFLVYGLKYVFPAEVGAISAGVTTGHSSPILKDYFVFEESDQYVWPSTYGKTKGYALQPLYPNQPIAALNDQLLYDKLALVDAIRVGRTRERNKAAELLKEIFKPQYAFEHYQNQGR
jgi:hypothetical protein